MKKAFVTGGSRGIGKGIVKVLAQAGYEVAFTYYSEEEEAIELQQNITKNGGKCHVFQASLEKSGVAEEVTRKAIEQMEGIDLMVCNAGLTRHDSVLTMTEELLDFVYNLNYRSYLMCAKEAANSMVTEKVAGSILFMSSTRGESPHINDSTYGGFKAAINRSVKSIALDLAQYGIRVNSIAPGATAVRGEDIKGTFVASQIPLKRMGTAEEVGHLVKYLASEEASYITGETIRIDGGLVLPAVKEVK